MQDKFLNRSKSSTYQRWFWIKTRVEASTYVQRNVLNKNMGRFTKLTYQGKFFKGNKLRKVLSGNRRVVLRKVISYHWENVMGINTNVCHFLFQVLNQLAHLKINVKDSFNRYKAFCVLSPELPRKFYGGSEPTYRIVLNLFSKRFILIWVSPIEPFLKYEHCELKVRVFLTGRPLLR